MPGQIGDLPHNTVPSGPGLHAAQELQNAAPHHVAVTLAGLFLAWKIPLERREENDIHHQYRLFRKRLELEQQPPAGAAAPHAVG